MRSVLDNMKATTNRGERCVYCTDTAVDCQIAFVTLHEWCCRICRQVGPMRAHCGELVILETRDSA